MTTHSRSGRRFQLARLAVAFGGMDRGVSSLLALVRVPLLVWGLGLYQYGLYMAILGLTATAGLLDFGLHLGVLNAVAAARGRDDEASIRRTVATAFLSYTAIVVAAGALILPAVSRLPLDALLGIEPGEVPLARQVVLLAAASLLLPMPLKVFSAGLDGFQKQYVTAIYRSVSSLVRLGLLAGAVVLFRERLLLVVAVSVAGELLHWIGLAFYAVHRQGELALHLGSASRTAARALVPTSLLFFVANLANLFKVTLGSTIVSHGLGPEAVPAFSVPFALFMTAYGLASLVSASFWPAYGEAAARGEWSWVERAFSLSARTAVGLGAFFAVLGALFGDRVVDLWIPGRVAASPRLLALLALWLLAQTAVHAVHNLLSGLGRVRVVTATSLVEGLGVFVLSLWLVGTVGVEGVAAAMALAASASAAVLLLVVLPRSTQGRLSVPWGGFLRIGVCLLAAAAAGGGARYVLGGAPPLLIVGAGAGTAAAVFAATAWRLALTPDERRRLRAWARL